nr:MAG TPA: hypothetical protein [Caudoviricetes sp.]
MPCKRKFIPPTSQNSTRGFVGAFPAICRIFPMLCDSAYQIQAPRRTLYRAGQQPIIIMYKRECAGAPCYGSMPGGAS